LGKQFANYLSGLKAGRPREEENSK